MTTTAAGYGCCWAGIPPFALLPRILSTRRETPPPPPPRASLVASSSKLRALAPRLRVSNRPRRLIVSASSSGEANSDAAPSPTEAAIDIKLPRRSLLVQFTCNACGERTKRLINRVAYERGTVFLQCAGCQVYHKFVDNLGLVVEYDLREENELQGENAVDTSSED
ncbi:etched 1 [Zea mays]|uniref:ETCHED1 protein n=1 Tax=Zea mays TaxID=4577 RepID=A0A1D6NLJ3_MAIZE|nr:etched 1 [Zea mays]ONM41087.1 ETCHED1 protein [Zea mays]ONM41089.1 ETCHED1 protein [Zea mays]|eukprot:NP_001309777.1 etched 1 [Zea mays]